MIPYPSNVIHVEDDILDTLPIINNRITILVNKTPVVMTTVWFFYIASTWVTSSSMGIKTSAEILF